MSRVERFRQIKSTPVMKLPFAFRHRLPIFGDFLSLLDKYILWQLISPLLLSVGIFSALGVSIGNLSDLANKVVDYHLPIVLAIKILLLKVPEFIAYSLPVAVLLAMLMTYGRLNSDSELIALRTCGFSFYRLVLPGIIISLMVTALSFIFNELVVPSANHQATSILVESIDEEQEFWQNKDIFYPDYENITLPDGQSLKQLKSLLYAEKFDGVQMKSLTILKWLGNQLTQIVISDSAQWNNQENIWDFFNGTIYNLAADQSYQETLPFTHQQFLLPKAAFDYAYLGRNPGEMSIWQAQSYKNLLVMSGDRQKARLFEVRIQQKLAFPFVCLVFGLVGATLGSAPKSMSRGQSFGLTLLIVFGYYVLNFLTGSLGIINILSPFLAAWLPNLCGLGVGSWLLYQLNN